MNIRDNDFPALYQSADQSSLVAQRRYFLLQRCHVICLILGSAGTILTTLIPDTGIKWANIVWATILIIGIIFVWVSRGCRHDKVWFDCRAIAESTKTAAWRFMMKAAPFKDDSTATQSFVDQLRQIREARPSSPRDLAQSLDSNARSISCSMNRVRQKSLNERKNIYLESRLRDQKDWYLKKAKFNSKKELTMFNITLALQFLAVLFAIIWASSISLSINVIPVLMTSAAVIVAWAQMKRYSELEQTYSLAAQELIDQETIALGITEEARFLRLVEQVEETISREHTMWCARRDTTVNPTINTR